MILTDQIEQVRSFRLARTFLGRGLYFTAAYWIDGLMVDTGCRHTLRELIPALEGLPITTIVNTHSHEDHIAGNAVLQERTGARILAHPLALPLMAAPRAHQALHLYQKVMWGHPAPSRGEAVGPTVETRHFCFQVLHTPGHSPDHICLYEPNRCWLFTGDAYVGGRDRALRADYDIWGILASLKQLAVLRIDRLFPGSGKNRSQPGAEIRDKIDYLEETGQKVLALHRNGTSPAKISRMLFGREMPIAYFTLGHFSGVHLVRSFLRKPGHLKD